MKQHDFLKNMLRYAYLPLVGMVLLVLLDIIIVQGNRVASVAIDGLLAGKSVDVAGFMRTFLPLVAVGSVAAYAASVVNGRFAVLVVSRYRQQLAHKLMRMEYRYFDEHNSATVLNKVISDIGELQRFLSETLGELMADVVAVVIYGSYVWTIHKGLFVLVLVCYPPVLYIAKKIADKIMLLTQNYRGKTDTITRIAQDAISGILVVRSSGAEPYFQEKMHTATCELVENERKRTEISNTAWVIRELLQWLPTILCAVYCMVLVSQSSLSLGSLLSFILVLAKLVEAFITIPFLAADASGSLVCMRRVEELLAADEEPLQPERELPQNETVISFEKAVFSYDGETPVLQDITFRIKKGESVAFIGESGCGKSTIFKLLCGFYEVQGGSMSLYGRDYKEWSRAQLRSHFALVSQNVFLFPTTVAENVRYGRVDATREEIIEACKKAEIHTFIETLPQGYDTLVGERGAMLSGGQRQRISIARAILKDAPILLLDEPTSSIDESTEQEITRALAAVSVGRTTLTIAHRLSTISAADRVYTLQNGRIGECI